jgi:hypothetical protein
MTSFARSVDSARVMGSGDASLTFVAQPSPHNRDMGPGGIG